MDLIPGPVQWVKGFSIAEAVARVAAMAQIQPPAWELPYVMVQPLKEKKKKRKKEEGEEITTYLMTNWPLTYLSIFSGKIPLLSFDSLHWANILST